MVGTLSIAGYRVRSTTGRALCRHLAVRCRHARPTTVFFANTNFVNRCTGLRQEINRRDDVLVVNDGIGVDLASLCLHGRAFSENLNGTDLTPVLLRQGLPGARVFLLGADPAVVADVARRLPDLACVRVAGACDGYSLWEDEEAAIAAINGSAAEVLLVALGNPLQEQWILAHRERLAPVLVIGVGGYFDFVAGKRRRAPHLVRKARLEWLFRLAQEPRRLFRRYSVEMLAFFLLCVRTRNAALDAALPRRQAS